MNELFNSFGYAAPPTEEDILAQALARRKGAEATQEKDRLAEQMLRAEALRDREGEYGSIMGTLGSMIRGDVGRERVRNIQGQEQGVDQRAADYASQVASIEDKKAQSDAQNYVAAQRQALYGTQQDAALKRARLAMEANKANKAEKIAEPSRMYNEKTGEWFDGRYDSKTGTYINLDAEGEVVPATDVKRFGDMGMTSQDVKIAAKAPNAMKVTDKYLGWTQDDWNRVSVPTEIGRRLQKLLPENILTPLLNKGETYGVLQWLDSQGIAHFSEEERQRVRESLGVFSDINLNAVMPFREDTTSGQLSDRDVKEFTTNILFGPGMTGDVLYNSANRMLSAIRSYGATRRDIYETGGTREAFEVSQRVYGDMATDEELEKTRKERGELHEMIKAAEADLQRAGSAIEREAISQELAELQALLRSM